MSSLNDPRVLFAAERTLLAWNRTSLSLIGFGFVVERMGLMLPIFAPERAGKQPLFFWLGVAFIAMGASCAIYSARQYAVVLAALTPAEFPPRYSARWSMAANIMVGVLGFALIAALSL